MFAFAFLALATAPEPECEDGFSYQGEYVEPTTGECISWTEPECLSYSEPSCSEYDNVCTRRWHGMCVWWERQCVDYYPAECTAWSEPECTEYEHIDGYWEGECVADPIPSPTMPPEPTGTPVPSPTPTATPVPPVEPKQCTDSGMPACKRMGTCPCLGLHGAFLTSCEYYNSQLGGQESNANQMCMGLANYGGNRNFLDVCIYYWMNR